MEEAGGVMRAGRGTNCPGEGDICTDSSRKRSLQLLTPRRMPTRPEVKAQRETLLEEGVGRRRDRNVRKYSKKETRMWRPAGGRDGKH